MTATPAIQLGDVSWTYRGVETPALYGLDMTIDRGETVVLAGASGSGKSTILRLMNGLIPHLHEGRLTGDVRLLGASTTALDLAGFGRKTGSVWQHPFRQFFASTVTDEIAFALENHGDVPERIRHRVDELLTSHDLVQVRNRLLSTLSSGQQQLVALLAAIAHRPQLLLLDEPSANLSESATARLVASLARLRGEGVTTVIAEHRISPFLPITDRIVSVSGGRLETTWRPQAFTRLSEHERSSHSLRPRTLPPLRAVPGVASGRSIEATAPQTSAHRADTPALRNEREGVTLENILCVKDGHVILDLDHAHFPPGRVTVLRGGNGAGKTTLARIIVGLQRHTGTVTVNGIVTSRRGRRRGSMLITQEVQRQLFADTVRGELDLAARGSPDAPGVANLFAQLDLEHLAERHPLSLSGGQQQRLAIAVARLSDRPVVVLDEPSTGVDARHLDTISRLISGLATAGRTVIVITHDRHLRTMTADVEITLRGTSARPTAESSRKRRGDLSEPDGGAR